MDESKDKERWCNTIGVCALDSDGNYRNGSYAKALHTVCTGVSGGGASLCTRIKVQTDGEREKLVKEKESHIEPSLSIHTHTHTQPRCPVCGCLLVDTSEKYLVECENCMQTFFLQEYDD